MWKDAGFLVISCTTFLGSELSFSVSMFLTVPGLLRLWISVDMILMSTPSISATGVLSDKSISGPSIVEIMS